jgi:hypothetical protein
MALHALLHLDLSQGQLPLLPRVVRDGRGAQMHGEEADLATPASYKLRNWLQRKYSQRAWRLAGAVSMLAASILFIVWYNSIGLPDVGSTGPQQIAKTDAEQPATTPKADFLSPQKTAIAVLGQASRASWSDPSLPLNNGATLTAGKFKLQEGLVQLEFVSGASVVIEAPAEFELLSPNRISCALGKIRAHVPNQAIGFTVETPTYSAVDLGTEFTVQVKPTGESQFQVLEGEVDLRGDRSNQPGQPQRLVAGQAVETLPDGGLKQLDNAKSPFVGTEQMLQMANAALRERYDSWKRFSREIRTAPNVLLYYGFDDHEPWERVLRNEGPDKSETLNGAIVGCQWTTGRWAGKQALEFKRTTDRVRVNVPGEFASLTYSAWFRIEGLERWLSSLMLTDGHQPGEVHWQMTDQGQLMLGVKAEPEKSHDFYSPSVIGPKDLGRWVHLACVYNGETGYVAHYLDGTEVSRENIRIPTKLRIGPAEIGNWVPQDLREYRIRSLNGRIDEFILFDEALAPEQIHSIYEAGRPQS